MDIMICIDGPDGPVFEGPKDEPVWGLYSSEPKGKYWGEWEMSRWNGDMTYYEAHGLAEALGLEGVLIGS